MILVADEAQLSENQDTHDSEGRVSAVAGGRTSETS